MSAYYINLFRADPFRFINTYSVDIKGWFEGLMRHGGGGMSGALVQAANAKGVCRLDFAPIGGFAGFGVSIVQVQMIPHGGIDAYWVPYR